MLFEELGFVVVILALVLVIMGSCRQVCDGNGGGGDFDLRSEVLAWLVTEVVVPFIWVCYW